MSVLAICFLLYSKLAYPQTAAFERVVDTYTAAQKYAIENGKYPNSFDDLNLSRDAEVTITYTKQDNGFFIWGADSRSTYGINQKKEVFNRKGLKIPPPSPERLASAPDVSIFDLAEKKISNNRELATGKQPASIENSDLDGGDIFQTLLISEAKKALSNLPTEFSSTKAVPYVTPDSGGEMSGFKFSKISKDSLFFKMGFTTGDIVLTEGKNPSDMLWFLKNLNEAKPFSIKIIRKNRKHRIQYNFK